MEFLLLVFRTKVKGSISLNGDITCWADAKGCPLELVGLSLITRPYQDRQER